MVTIQETEQIRIRLEEILTLLIKRIGAIKIGNTTQFPYGWRKAAKGRTVWRIIEEAINQNLEVAYKEYGQCRFLKRMFCIRERNVAA